MNTTTISATKFELETEDARFYNQKAIISIARLFTSEGKLIAWARLMQGSIDMPESAVICAIETHPEYRRRGHARSLIEQAARELGPIYTTGNCSSSGAAFIAASSIPLTPEGNVHIAREEDYTFIDWSTGWQK